MLCLGGVHELAKGCEYICRANVSCEYRTGNTLVVFMKFGDIILSDDEVLTIRILLFADKQTQKNSL